VIEYAGDLLSPPDCKKPALTVHKKTIRDRQQDSDSDLDLSD
jgi:hypothetical protein